MASRLKQLSSKACQATQFVTKHGNVYYKQLMEQNKQYVQDPPTVEKCNLLAKQLLYTRLASIPGRTEAFWKELEYVKNLWKNRQELKVEDAGIAALFGLECFTWFCAGEIVGRGFTFTGATGDFVVDGAWYWLEFLNYLPYRKRNDYITKRPEWRTLPWPKNL